MKPAQAIVQTLLEDEDDSAAFGAKEFAMSVPPPIRSSDLGWLLRNWGKVTGFNYVYTGSSKDILTASLKDGRVYETDFADLTVCFRWLKRPVFIGLPLVINRTARWTIGSPEYRRVMKLDGAGGPEGYRAYVSRLLQGEQPGEVEQR